MDCPKSGKQANCKDGWVNDRQRYLCKDCNHRYAVAQRSSAGDGAVMRCVGNSRVENIEPHSIFNLLFGVFLCKGRGTPVGRFEQIYLEIKTTLAGIRNRVMMMVNLNIAQPPHFGMIEFITGIAFAERI